MTDVTRPGDGDSELAAPLSDESGGADRDDEDALDGGGTQAARTIAISRPSNVVLLLGAILLIVTAQLVMTWFVLSTNTQVRDQYVAANGLQRCIIRAELAQNQTTDPSGSVYKAAVNTCLK